MYGFLFSFVLINTEDVPPIIYYNDMSAVSSTNWTGSPWDETSNGCQFGVCLKTDYSQPQSFTSPAINIAEFDNIKGYLFVDFANVTEPSWCELLYSITGANSGFISAEKWRYNTTLNNGKKNGNYHINLDEADDKDNIWIRLRSIGNNSNMVCIFDELFLYIPTPPPPTKQPTAEPISIYYNDMSFASSTGWTGSPWHETNYLCNIQPCLKTNLSVPESFTSPAINITGYTNIKLQLFVHFGIVTEPSWCQLLCSIDGPNSSFIIKGQWRYSFKEKMKDGIYNIDLDEADDADFIWIRLRSIGNNSNMLCAFDELEIYTIPIPTKQPTMDPTTFPTNHLTSDPTADPTMIPTFDPTNDATINPSNITGCKQYINL